MMAKRETYNELGSGSSMFVRERTVEFYSQYPIEGIKILLSRCRPGDLERIGQRVKRMRPSPIVRGIHYRITPEIEKRFWLEAIRQDLRVELRGEPVAS